MDEKKKYILMFIAFVVIVVPIVITIVCTTISAKEIGVYNLETKYIKNAKFSYDSTCKNNNNYSSTTSSTTSSITSSKIISTSLKSELTIINIDKFIEDKNIDIDKSKKLPSDGIYDITIDSISSGSSNCSYFSKDKYEGVNTKKLKNIYKSSDSLNDMKITDVFDDDDLQLKLLKSVCGNYIVKIEFNDVNGFQNKIKK